MDSRSLAPFTALHTAHTCVQNEDFAWPTVREAMDFRQKVRPVQVLCAAQKFPAGALVQARLPPHTPPTSLAPQVYDAVVALIKSMPEPASTPLGQASPYWALFMGFEHERIHLETSSVLIKQLPVSSVRRPGRWQYGPSFARTPAEAPENTLLDLPAKQVVLGKPQDFPSYGWDNEYGSRKVAVPAFKAASFLVTNAEFLPFVMAGGYTQKKYWVSPAGDDEGWRWVTFRNATHPSWWVATKAMPQFIGGKPGLPYQKDDGTEAAGDGAQFRLRVMFDIVDMPWDWPVEVNYLEARAFLNWKEECACGVKFRMPTEAEYHVLRADPCALPGSDTAPDATAVAGGGAAGCVPRRSGPGLLAREGDPETGHSPITPCLEAGSTDSLSGKVDVIMQAQAPGNVNMRFGSSTPVDMFPPSAAGAFDTHGNVWEWAEDHFGPLPDFNIHFLYDDFSTPCFDGWHTMILGGSWVSTGDQASNFARYAFRRHFFQHLGFRYVALPGDAKEPFPGCATVANLWEGHGALSADLTDGYAPLPERLPSLAPVTPVLDYSPEEPGTLLGMAADYPAQLAQLVKAAYRGAVGGDGSPTSSDGVPASQAKVLHLGCGAGGGTLQLCAYFGLVVGVDASEPHIRHARVLQHHGLLEYQRTKEGVLTTTANITVPAALPRHRAVYALSALEELSEEVWAKAPYDVVVLDRVLDGMAKPLALAKALPRLVRPGGKIVVASANNWDASVTPRNSWLGGFCMNGEEFTTQAMLQHTWKHQLSLVSSTDVPRLSQASPRQFTLQVVQCTVWSREESAPEAGQGEGEDVSLEKA